MEFATAQRDRPEAEASWNSEDDEEAVEFRYLMKPPPSAFLEESANPHLAIVLGS
jgi:hypothetical protein